MELASSGREEVDEGMPYSFRSTRDINIVGSVPNPWHASNGGADRERFLHARQTAPARTGLTKSNRLRRWLKTRSRGKSYMSPNTEKFLETPAVDAIRPDRRPDASPSPAPKYVYAYIYRLRYSDHKFLSGPFNYKKWFRFID